MNTNGTQTPSHASGSRKSMLTLYRPDEEHKEMWITRISHYAESMLRPKFDVLIGFIQKYNAVRLLDEQGNETPCAILARPDRPLTEWKRSEKQELLAIFMAEARNFYAYFSTLPETQQHLWHEMTRACYMDEEAVSKILGRPIAASATHTTGEKMPEEELRWFESARYNGRRTDQRGDRVKEPYFFLPPILGTALYKLFYPLPEGLPGGDGRLPEEEGLMQFDGEQDIIGRMNMLVSLCKENPTERTRWRYTPAAVTRLKPMLKLEEFYPVKDKAEGQLRTALAAILFTLYLPLGGDSGVQAARIRAILDNMLDDPLPAFNLLFTHIAGMPKKPTYELPLSALAYNLRSVLRSCPKGAWVSMEELCLRMRHLEDYRYLSILFEPYQLDQLALTNTRDGEAISLSNIHHEMVYPFIQAMLFSFATFGAVEIAYHKVDETAPSLFSGLRYIRLTELGEYVLQLRTVYHPKEAHGGKQPFEIDDKILLVQAFGKENPFESFLTDIAEPIGGRRYLVTQESFLAPCDNRATLLEKIELFKLYFCAQPPANWEHFFEELLRRNGLLEEQPADQYILYKIPPEEFELQMLLSTDPELREYTLRAEKHLLLVDKKARMRFENRLKAFGYLL